MTELEKFLKTLGYSIFIIVFLILILISLYKYTNCKKKNKIMPKQTTNI
jgi:hypothetical protein